MEYFHILWYLVFYLIPTIGEKYALLLGTAQIRSTQVIAVYPYHTPPQGEHNQ